MTRKTEAWLVEQKRDEKVVRRRAVDAANCSLAELRGEEGEAMTNKAWWISWKEYAEDNRSLTWPPNDAILAFWETGVAGDNSYTNMVAWVWAPTLDEAYAAILKEWPQDSGVLNLRFSNETTLVDPSDRFPISGYSEARLAAARAEAKSQ